MIAPIAQQNLKPYTYRVLFCVLGVIISVWELLGEDLPPLLQTNNVTTSTAAAVVYPLNHDTVYTLPPCGNPDPIPTQRVKDALPRDVLKQLRLNDDDIGRTIFNGTTTTTTNNNPSSSCRITSQIKIHRHDLPSNLTSVSAADESISAETSSSSSWTLQTLDRNGNIKLVGGDEMYVTYTADGSSEPTAVAKVTDQHNGNYTLDFVTSPTLVVNASSSTTEPDFLQQIQQTTGRLEVWLEQSCGIGAIPPPHKNQWVTSGAINQRYVVAGRIPAPKHIQPFQHPNVDGRINFANFDQIAVLGASLVGQFACAENDQPSVEQCATFRPNLYKGQLVQAPLNSQTLERDWKIPAEIMLDKAYQLAREAAISKNQTQNYNNNNDVRIGIVVGSGVWDILADDSLEGGIDFANHLEACRELITFLQGRYPKVTIYWKSMTSMHIHQTTVMENWFRIQRIYYMSNSRSNQLYKLQTNLMRDELNVKVLDLYEATALSAAHTRHGDGRHYQPNFNRMTLDWFYP